MARKINAKLILELRELGMSGRAIAKSRNISFHSVFDVFAIADEKNIHYNDVKDMEEIAVYRLFFPDRYVNDDIWEKPDYEYVHNELKRHGVTLKLLWEEYSETCHSHNSYPVSYSKFCRGYKQYTASFNLVCHLEHKPGNRAEVDWAGKTMQYIDTSTGALCKAYLFVGVLSYSNYTYVEACDNMRMDTWLRCNINMYEYFGGVPVCTICDNLKTGVIKHPREGDIVLNAEYDALGRHYVTAIMPAGVRKPRGKATAECAVKIATTNIIARLRNETFYSFASLKSAVAHELEKYNAAELTGRKCSRKDMFDDEKVYLRSLPAIPYEIAHWAYGRSVNNNCHVMYMKNYYSCPYQHVGKKADLKITDTSVEVYVNGERVSTHNRLSEKLQYRYSTNPQDMPDNLVKMPWTYDRIMKWGSSIGSHTEKVLDRIFSYVSIKEQGFNASLSVLRLSKKYSPARLETACEIALVHVKSPRYSHLNAILSSNQDILYSESAKHKKKDNSAVGYVRGAAYYGGTDND